MSGDGAEKDAGQTAEHVGGCNPGCDETGHLLTASADDSGARMRCDVCPIEFALQTFAVLVADGWGQHHTFQRPEFNGGQVIACTGHFSLVGGSDA